MKQKKGFTLTELIIVIVIIGILAAVLIPSLTGYVKKARRSNDEQIAAEMTRVVNRYCSETAIKQSELLGTDVRTILLVNGFDLVPKSQEWTFVYDSTKLAISVVDVENGVLANWSINEAIDPTNYSENMFLISKGKNDFEKGIDILCNTTCLSEYESAADELDQEPFNSLYNVFNPENTLYISNNRGYAEKVLLQSTNTYGYNSITKIVYIENTFHIPNIDQEIVNKLNPNIPNSFIAKTIEKGSSMRDLYKGLHIKNEKEVNEIEINNSFKVSDAYGKTNYDYSSTISLRLGEYFEKAIYHDFNDTIEQVTQIDTNVYQISRKFCVSYYNEQGLFARGYILYTVIEDNSI